MSPTRWVLAGVVGAAGVALYLATADRPAPVAAQVPAGKAASPDEGIRAITAEYVKAFNAGDAKAAAALWTADGEYVGSDGERTAGRDAIAKDLADYFKAHPKAVAEVKVEAVRLIGRGTANVEGTVSVKLPGEATPVESRYTALHVNEDGVWHAASVKEWALNPSTDVGLKHLEWMVGDWAAKGEGEVSLSYEWDETKTFIRGKYAVSKGGKPVSSGTQVFGKNPTGGLRSWMFDSSGTTADAVWTRDGTRWISESTGVLPDGTEISSVSIIIPLGADAFTWQTTERQADGVPLPALPPLKVTRVKK